MKKIALAGLIVVVALVMLVPPSEAHGRRGYYRGGFRTSVVIGVGPGYYWGGYPYPYRYPYWHYPAPSVVYAPPPVVVQEAPPVYVQQTPPAAAPPAVGEQFWYYCQSAGAYYPSVSSCPEAWVKVAPRP
jgi:hypothetical protein